MGNRIAKKTQLINGNYILTIGKQNFHGKINKINTEMF